MEGRGGQAKITPKLELYPAGQGGWSERRAGTEVCMREVPQRQPPGTDREGFGDEVNR